MATEMLQRRGTAAEWAAVNPVLDDGELGFERDTGIIKIGDGVTAWNDIISAYVRRDLVDAAGDLLVGSGANTVARLPKGASNQRLTTLPDGTVAWADLPAEDNPMVVIDAAGDLIVGSADNAAVRLARGSTGQRLTVNADGTLGWVNMPDLSGFETSSHAASTYETIADAAGRYETLVDAALRETAAHATATFETLTDAALRETAAHAAATYRPLAYTQYVEKTADTSRTNNTLQINDPELLFAVAANTTWIFEALLFVDGSGGDINIQINGPAGADVSFAGAGPHNTAATGSNATGEWVGRASGAPNSAAIPFGTVSTSRMGIHLRGRMKVGATAGNLNINWGQLTAGGVSTTIVAGSWLEGRRVV